MSGSKEDSAYWEDDQKMALGRSHGRTMASLEEAAYEHEAERKRRIPRPASPKEHIVPSVEEIQSEAEEAKRRARKLSPSRTRASREESTDEKFHVLPYKNFSKYVSEDSPDELSDSSPSFRASSRRHVVMMLCAASVLLAATVVLVLPSTKNAIDKTLSSIVLSTEAALVHGRTSQQLLQVGSLVTGMPNTTVDYDGLFSPSYYPIEDVLPVLFQIPHSGSHAARDILAYCMRLTFADERGALFQSDEVSLSRSVHDPKCLASHVDSPFKC